MLSAAFQTFCTDCGISVQDVDVSEFCDGVRGVVALQDIRAGTQIVSVPRSALFGLDKASSPTWAAALESLPSRPADRVLLTAFLLLESANRSSRWRPYLQTLPRQYPLLGFFPSRIVEELQVPDAIEACHAARAKARADYEQARPLLAALGLPLQFRSRNAWRFAAGAVSSRTMHFPGDAVGVLTPFADMHNYCPPPAPVPPALPGDPAYRWPGLDSKDAPAAVAAEGDACTHLCTSEAAQSSTRAPADAAYDGATGCYTFTAARDYQAGEQVYLCYGHYTNLQVLEIYGFLLPENPHDEVRLRRDCWPDAINGIEMGFLHPDGRPSWHLLVVLRLHFASPLEDRSGMSACVHSGEPISVGCERRVFQSIAEACQKELSACTTSTRQDEAALVDMQSSAMDLETECRKLALQYRMQHKRAVARACKRATECLRVLPDCT